MSEGHCVSGKLTTQVEDYEDQSHGLEDTGFMI